MNKKYIWIFITILVLMQSLPLAVGAKEYKGFEYTVAEDGVTITGYNGQAPKVVVPDTIDSMPVTSIAEKAFYAAAAEHITLPDTLRSIGRRAFTYCRIRDIHLPVSVSYIHPEAFQDSWHLTHVDVDPANEGYFSDDGVLYRRDSRGSVLMHYPTDRDGAVYYLQDDVHTINNFAIYYPHHLTSLIESDDSILDTLTPDSIIGYPLTVYGNIGGVLEQEVEGNHSKYVLNFTYLDKSHVGSFDDVALPAWYSSDVHMAAHKKLMTGVADRVFSPGTALTREQLVMVMFNMCGAEAQDYTGATGFADAPEGMWYSPAVKWARQEGIVSGIGGGYFGTGIKVTREQVALILKNYAESKDIEIKYQADLSKYVDHEEISPWAMEAMSWAVYEGIYYSTTKDILTLAPVSPATRAEAASVVVYFCNYVEYMLDPNATYLRRGLHGFIIQ